MFLLSNVRALASLYFYRGRLSPPSTAAASASVAYRCRVPLFTVTQDTKTLTAVSDGQGVLLLRGSR